MCQGQRQIQRQIQNQGIGPGSRHPQHRPGSASLGTNVSTSARSQPTAHRRPSRLRQRPHPPIRQPDANPARQPKSHHRLDQLQHRQRCSRHLPATGHQRHRPEPRHRRRCQPHPRATERQRASVAHQPQWHRVWPRQPGRCRRPCRIDDEHHQCRLQQRQLHLHPQRRHRQHHQPR